MIFFPSPKPALRACLATMGVAVVASLVLAPVSGARAETTATIPSPGDVEMKAAMLGMKPATDHMTMTGDVDRDFMLMMIPHHDAGIAMSSAEDGFGEHTKLKDMAVVDIADQRKDNRDMREYLKHPSSPAKASGSAQTADNLMMDAMHKMDQSMNGMKLNGNQDHDFIMMMIPHHEAAIAMSQVELKYGTDPRVKKVAEGVIKGQSKDIKDMTGWHKDWFGDNYPM